MADANGKHVFVSYVREDAEAVDSLCAVLEAAQIPYWRDRDALGPGDAWRAKIKQAIREGSLVFLACFSDNSRARDKSYMNEELTLAVDEFRQMPLGRTWLIPVRFDDGEVPEWDLGAGRSLTDLNYSDLFGADHLANAARLVTTIHRLIGEKQPDAATAMAAVEQATQADRTDLLRRLTKDMLPDPTRRIELDDLVAQETKRILSFTTNPDEVGGLPRGASQDEIIVHIAEKAWELWTISEPFCASLHVAARWGTPELLAPWSNGLRSFATAANKLESGNQALLELRHLPALVGLATAALTCASAGNWANLKVLTVDPTVRDRHSSRPLSLLEAEGPYKAFSQDWISQTLAKAALQDKSFDEALTLVNRGQKYHTPVSEWLHHILRPTFLDQWPDQDSYDDQFDRAEVMLGVLAQDAANARADANPNGGYSARSYWFGRSTWRASHYQGNAAEDIAHELSTQKNLWGPLQADLFGGDPERARLALDTYVTDFNEISRKMF